MNTTTRIITGGAVLCAAVAATVTLAAPALADGAAPAYVTFDKHAGGPGEFEFAVTIRIQP